MRGKILGEVRAAGGSISRLPAEVYREAADLAYYFHWQRGDIMDMSMNERKVWLDQIKRIHYEQKAAREKDLEEQAEYLANIKNQARE
jgi:hypothetical protein